MTCHSAFLSTALAALGLASCADPAGQAPATEARTSPVFNTRAGLPSNLLAASPADTGRITRIPLGTLFEIQQSAKVLIFDVRPSFLYQLGHIPGAVNWPRGRFESQLTRHETQIQQAVVSGKPVVLYCTDLACPDAREVATRLAARGHSVAVLEGGWDAWKTGGLPTD
jgi:rhodanese-related sulfurtransferase